MIGDRDTANLGVIFGRNRDFGLGLDRLVAPDNFRAILKEGRYIALRIDSGRLVSRRPHVATMRIAQKYIRSPGIAGSVLAPSRDGDVLPAAVARACCGDHDRVPPVG